MIWLQIIEVMQDKDNLTMGRIIYLTRQSTNKYLDFFNFNGDYLKDRQRGVEFFNILESNLEDGEKISNSQFKEYELYNNNPFLTGARLLDLMVSSSGLDGLMEIPKFMCHLYNALKSEGYIKQEIPFLEIFINTFRNFLFSNYNQVPSRGNFLNSSLIKSNYSLDYISALKRGDLTGSSIRTKMCKIEKKTFGALKGESLSKLVKILECDFTQLNAKDLSIMDLVDSIEDITYSEIFCENRVLSLHCLKCLRIFYSIYIRLRIDILGSSLPSIGNESGKRQLKDLIFPFANFLNMSFLKFLDQPYDNKNIIFQLQKVSRCLTNFLEPMNIEKEIYVFDNKFSPKISSVFGLYQMKNVSIEYVLANCASNDLFKKHIVHSSTYFMELIGTVNENTSNEEKRMNIDDLKNGILVEPNILLPVYEDRELSCIMDLCIVKFQDQDLIEWLIQMKGLLIRGYGRQRLRFAGSHNTVSNNHLSVAVKYDADWAVDIILAATQGQDIGQSGFAKNNSVFHECAIKDKIEIFVKIFSMRPVMNTNDDMQSPFNLAKGPKFKQYMDELKTSGIQIEMTSINDVFNPNEYNQIVRNRATPTHQIMKETRSHLNNVITTSTNIRKSLQRDSLKYKIEVTPEEIARVAQNERELFAIWGDGEKNEIVKKNNKKKRNNTKNNKKKKC